MHKMKKIIVTVGISGSGKSTFAHNEWLKKPLETVVINRDSIRNLLFSFTDETISEYYKRADLTKLEKIVTKYEDTLINEALCEDKTVIVDATHLKKEFLERFKYWNVSIEYKYFDISIEDAIERDSKRNRSVGAGIIKRQYNQYIELQRQGIPLLDFKPLVFKNDNKLPDCWVFDIDNTIAHKGNRNPFDWKNVGEDTLDEAVSKLFFLINRDEYYVPDKIIFCSGRDEICRKDTEEWLKYHLGKYNNYTLLMRKAGDSRPDWIVKQELWEEIATENYIVALIDDRNQVCMRARALGLKVFQVEYGNF
jgi:predicted kinase